MSILKDFLQVYSETFKLFRKTIIELIISIIGISIFINPFSIYDNFSTFFDYLFPYQEVRSVQTIRFIGAIIIAIGFTFFIIKYLNQERRSQKNNLDETLPPVTLAEIHRLRNEYKKLLSNSTTSKIDISKLEESIRSEALSQLPENLIKSLELKYATKSVNENQVNVIRTDLLNISKRLNKFLDKANLRGNINLGIGGGVTALGVLILLLIALETKPAEINKDFPALLAHYIPRISTIIFIEIFAFFFLKLYKATLQEIKYFQNELTNIELQKVAIETALLQNYGKNIEGIILQLIKTERNPIKQIDSDSGEKNSLSVKDVNSVIETLSKVTGKG